MTILHASRKLSRGQSLLEMALLLALVVVIVIGSLMLFGITVQQMYCTVVGIFGVKPAVCSCSLDLTGTMGNMSNWNVTSGNAWDGQSAQLCTGYKSGGEQRAFAGDASCTDYTVKVTSTLAKGDGDGVYFRITNEPAINGYVFQYDPGYRGGQYVNGAFLIRKIVNGSETGPLAAVPAPTDFNWYNVSHQLSVRVYGKTMTGYVDGRPVVSATDSDNPRGRVGLRTWDSSQACFADLKVSP
jgi:hypothetical protein